MALPAPRHGRIVNESERGMRRLIGCMMTGPKESRTPVLGAVGRGDGPAGLVSLTIEHNYQQQATRLNLV